MDLENVIDLLSKITATNSSGEVLFENNLKCILDLDPTSSKNENENIRFSCVMKATELLFHLKDCLLNQSANSTENILSVTQCATVSKCIDFIVSFGFIPCLIPSVWKSFENKQKFVCQLADNITPNKKYEELKFNVNSIFVLIKEQTFKRLFMSKHTNVLLAGLCQLCLLPIAKPGSKIAAESDIDDKKYNELIKEQKMFKHILKELILTHRDPLIIREIIFILGQKNCQKHLRISLGEIFSSLLIQSNGIQTFLRVACDLITETSKDFYQHGLQEWSNLIHSFYIKSKTKYTQFIVPQIWELLRSNSKFHQHQFQSIAVYCMHLMTIENYDDFLVYYLNPVSDSMKRSKLQNKTNSSVSQCIEDLHSQFYLFRNQMWSLNPKLLTHIAPTIYNIYTATAGGIYYLKSKLEDLVYLVLIHFSISQDHLKLVIFSQYQIEVTYDDEAKNINITYNEREHQLNLENEVNMVLDLMDKHTDLKLMETMFITLLGMYTDMSSNEYSVMEKLFIVKSIHYLIGKDDVQKSISTDPEIVLDLIKSLLNFKDISKDDKMIDFQVLSIALMILGCILENTNKISLSQLNYFMDNLSKIDEMLEDKMLKEMVLEITQKISMIKNVNIIKPVSNQRTIDDILFDTRDPLLPCRAHALIELKKMIESGDKTVLAKKSAILVVIQENLKNADSYLYLSAIFTLSSLCSFYPDDILPLLCEEYSMPKNYNHSAETRLKIGEGLMKTIRSLNETIPMYKNRLLNTFLAGVRDDDHLVRASSLSNLADVCRLLHYNLGSIVAEIIKCADYVLKYDPAVEPRRAAVLLLQMIIQGADSDLLQILEGSIKEIYQMLKFQYQCTKDDSTKLHAQVAIERLNDIMKSLFLNEKKIVYSK